VAITVAVLALATPALATGGSNINLLAKLAPEITRARTGRVAVLIPTTIHADVAASKLYASGGRTAGGYDIQLAYAPGCEDATACFFADFQAGPTPLLSGTRVTLAHAITGSFVGIHCGASCAPATIAWKESGVLYSVQYVLGGRATMIAMADSAIEAGPR